MAPPLLLFWPDEYHVDWDYPYPRDKHVPHMQVILDSLSTVKPEEGREGLMGLLCVCKLMQANAPAQPDDRNLTTCRPDLLAASDWVEEKIGRIDKNRKR